MRKGFTLVEVLIAFAILTAGLILVAAEFGRHLAALQLLQAQVTLRAQADREMVGEILRREGIVQVVGDEEPAGISITGPAVKPVSFDEEPLKGLTIDQATVGASLKMRNRVQSAQITTGFRRKQE
ncbi:MAG: prepilin-type N-terminal cleavage/methylation domain-containing protein [Candidatus Omnitrophica bacterium]|nr:prepilin-type N-terminal cleavage/methylation domain-containing protein [Candidatus Omnitrophota bacterium]